MTEPQTFRELVFETLQHWAGGWEDDFGRVARDAYLSATRQPGSGCPVEWERVGDRDRLVWVMVGAVVLEHAGRLLRAKAAAVDGKLAGGPTALHVNPSTGLCHWCGQPPHRHTLVPDGRAINAVFVCPEVSSDD